MTIANEGSDALTVAVARKSLDRACDDLDNAVRAIPDIGSDDDVLLNAGLVALLLRVVGARRHLSSLGVESGAASGLPSRSQQRC